MYYEENNRDFLIGYDKYTVYTNKDSISLSKAIRYIQDNENKRIIEGYLQEAKIFKKIGRL